MVSRLSQAFHEEIVSVYLGANAILGAVVTLGVHLTKDQIGAIIVIANVVLGPIVRHQVTPTVPTVPPPPPG